MNEDTFTMWFILGLLFTMLLVLLNFGGCQYKEYKLEKQKLEAQAAGKIPPSNVYVYRLDEEQLRQLIEAIKGAGHGN